MTYIYHRKPKMMQGTTLYSLSKLAMLYPPLYSDAVKKYQGRESILDEKLPLIACRWQDVVHFSTVHPHLIYREFHALGIKVDANDVWYRIPISTVPNEGSVYYKNDIGRNHGDATVKAEHLRVWDAARFSELKDIPAHARDFYASQVQEGRRPLMFHRLPHVLVKDQFELSAFEQIRWSDSNGMVAR